MNRIGKFVLLFAIMTLLNSAYAVSASFKKRDDVITAQLQAQIAQSGTLRVLPITISTTDSVVTIIGKVMNENQAKMLVTVAQSIAGVSGVDTSGLIFGQNKQLSHDASITSQLIGVYRREGLMNSINAGTTNIKIQTINGVVYLNGTVASDDEAASAVSFAQSIPGVSRVESNLTKVAQ